MDACTAYAKTRQQFGRPIGSFQFVQDMIARMAVDLDAARLLVYRAGHLKNQEHPNTLGTSIVKFFTRLRRRPRGGRPPERRQRSP